MKMVSYKNIAKVEKERKNIESEVARLRQQIETEIEGMKRGLSDFAVVSPHMVITNKYDKLGVCQEQLACSIGEEAAARYVYEAYMRIIG